MTVLSTTNDGSARTTQPRGAAVWLSLAASPTFALMAWIAATDPSAVCAPGSGMSPIGGMTAMYVLMGVFHLSAWLRLASHQ